jgi:hypothetical protein
VVSILFRIFAAKSSIVAYKYYGLNIINMLKVTDVEYMGDYSLVCWFNNGEKKYVDLEPLLKYPMFEELRDKELFKQFGLDGTLFWANGADIAPEYLLENGREWPPTMAAEPSPTWIV